MRVICLFTYAIACRNFLEASYTPYVEGKYMKMQTPIQIRLKPPRKTSSQRIHVGRSAVHGNDKSDVNILALFLSSLISLILDIISKISPPCISSWFRWCPTSMQTLEAAEKEVLSNLQRPYSVMYVNIGKCWSEEDNFIWTLKMCPSGNSEKLPLVLLHGFASGIGMWISNLDSLSAHHPVYAFDVLGFGRSSHPEFSPDAAEAEQQFVTSIEMWRKALKLDKMILVGHSMGGFLVTSYALRHPDHVALLILVDPWGFPERPIMRIHKYELPNWVKFIYTFISGFNLLAALRAAGPAGPYLVDRFRQDLQKKYSHCLKNPKSITRYIYHCNAQGPSGEVGFKAMADEAGWAKYPMITRISRLDYRLPIEFIYGSRSWVNRQPALQIKYSRLNSYVGVQVIDTAGHHVYADQPSQFNALVYKICEKFENCNL